MSLPVRIYNYGHFLLRCKRPLGPLSLRLWLSFSLTCRPLPHPPEMKCQGQLGAAKRRKNTNNKQKQQTRIHNDNNVGCDWRLSGQRDEVFIFEEKRGACCAPLWHCQITHREKALTQTHKQKKTKTKKSVKKNKQWDQVCPVVPMEPRVSFFSWVKKSLGIIIN